MLESNKHVLKYNGGISSPVLDTPSPVKKKLKVDNEIRESSLVAEDKCSVNISPSSVVSRNEYWSKMSKKEKPAIGLCNRCNHQFVDSTAFLLHIVMHYPREFFINREVDPHPPPATDSQDNGERNSTDNLSPSKPRTIVLEKSYNIANDLPYYKCAHCHKDFDSKDALLNHLDLSDCDKVVHAPNQPRTDQ